MQVKINVSRDVVDGILKPHLCGVERVSRLSGSFSIDTPNGHNSAPFVVGQAIRLKPKCNPIIIDKQSNVVYDVASKTWNIVLSRWYAGDFDNRIPQIMNEYGFDRIEDIQTQQKNEEKKKCVYEGM